MNSFQLKISLDYTTPPVWRRILVNENTTMYELHHIIQITMGWDNYHLWAFRKGREIHIGIPNDEFEEMETMWGSSPKTIDAKTVKLCDFFTKEKETLKYEYDFGDSWYHTITLEKIITNDTINLFPKCLAGKLNCPPEDCGSIPGYYNIIELMKQPKHKEYKEMVEWLGEPYDSEKFDIEFINENLIGIKEYIKNEESML